jgi:DNA-directed RNA polymerase specialized sigma24 family protein
VTEELALYEGLRRGSGRAFRRLVELHAAPMGRVARLYADDDATLVRRAWGTALNGLNMFTWHTTFRTWVFGILVGYGRSSWSGARALGDTPGPAPAAPEGALPLDWTTLAWSPRWTEAGWQTVEQALAGLPLNQREALWFRDVEAWPPREVFDVLGLPEAEGRRLLDDGRATLAEALRVHLAEPPCPAHEAGAALRPGALLDAEPTAEAQAHTAACAGCRCALQRARGVAALLRGLAPSAAGRRPVDRELVAVFRVWRRSRRLRPWRRLPVRRSLLAHQDPQDDVGDLPRPEQPEQEEQQAHAAGADVEVLRQPAGDPGDPAVVARTAQLPPAPGGAHDPSSPPASAAGPDPILRPAPPTDTWEH